MPISKIQVSYQQISKADRIQYCNWFYQYSLDAKFLCILLLRRPQKSCVSSLLKLGIGLSQCISLVNLLSISCNVSSKLWIPLNPRKLINCEKHKVNCKPTLYLGARNFCDVHKNLVVANISRSPQTILIAKINCSEPVYHW